MATTRRHRATRPEESLESILTRLEPRLRHMVSRSGIPEQDGDDLIQETLLAFVHKRDQIAGPEAWLMGAFRKQCLFYLRTHRRRLYDAIDGALLESVACPGAAGQEQAAMAHDLRKALARIPQRCRSVLSLRYRLGFKPAEVADELGYQPSSIRKITTRCLAALTKRMVTPNSGEASEHA